MFRFIVEHRSQFRVEKMCRILAVSRSGFYKWQARQALPATERQVQREILTKKITTIFNKDKNFGSPRVTDQLRKANFNVQEKTVARIMKKEGLRSFMIKKFRVCTTDSNHDLPISPNILNRQFKVAAPNVVWVTDITYIHTREGRQYLASVLDLCTKKIVGFQMGSRMTVDLVLSALDKACEAMNPPAGLLHHSDRGSQYASKEYREKLQSYKMISSMSRKGNCYDNACIEAFHSTLKRELVYQEKFKTKAEAQHKIFDYIEFKYNRQRPHSSLGYLSPDRFEAAYYARLKK
jgi:putative transposase